ncbi:hypothetical protein LY78DRAFT_663264 [Colletotrichum sublineola]|nr:hypothetical protein LY78DRAFT_663264 [Colletotrichum sublineola]
MAPFSPCIPLPGPSVALPRTPAHPLRCHSCRHHPTILFFRKLEELGPPSPARQGARGVGGAQAQA